MPNVDCIIVVRRHFEKQIEGRVVIDCRCVRSQRIPLMLLLLHGTVSKKRMMMSNSYTCRERSTTIPQ